METVRKKAALALALGAAAWPALAAAQDAGGDLMTMAKGELRGALQQRHDAAVAAMTATVNANDPRYIWAFQAKAQCGIALGFLKSGTRDPLSIGKCADAYARMQAVPMAPMAMAPTPVSTITAEACRQPIIGTVFFEFDSAEVPASSNETLQFVSRNLAACGWTGLNAVGHTDRSGSDAYNEALALRRANAVAAALAAGGVPPGFVATSGKGESEPRVPTADGIREAQNRRVEISAR